MSDIPGTDADRVGHRWAGALSTYDTYRPSPPGDLLDALQTLARSSRPTVVDLGSGTGLSSRVWADRATRVVGIEPSPQMRQYAIEVTTAPNVEYRAGTAEDTGLPGDCADIVTASSAIHWMDPVPTFSEAARVLRPGGIVAAYFHHNPLSLQCPEVSRMYYEMVGRHRALDRELGLTVDEPRWKWSESLAALQHDDAYIDVCEFRIQVTEQWTTADFIGWILSTGQVQGLLGSGFDLQSLGVTAIEERARDGLGVETTPWLLEYQVMAGRTAPAG